MASFGSGSAGFTVVVDFSSIGGGFLAITDFRSGS